MNFNLQMTRFQLLLFFFCYLHRPNNAISDDETTAAFWEKIGNEELEKAIEMENLNREVAKNVIIFLGDGMSLSTVTAARILKGQLLGNKGEETKLTMDQFHHAALSKTYSADRQVSDSGSTATAYLCGVKTNNYMLGLTAAATMGNCSSSKGEEKIVNSVLVDAWKEGKAAGFVTTTPINHATPGAVYAHTPSRRWYSDADLPDEALDNGCQDIAQQFYNSSHMFKVVLGGGRASFMPSWNADPEYNDKNASRLDGQNLIDMWMDKHSKYGEAKYVWNKNDFDQVDPMSTDFLLGLFEPKNMQYEANRLAEDKAGEPSISEMTEKAIKMLQRESNGFFLLVEGGRIDHGHHAGKAYLALHDTVAFDDAISKAVEMTSDDDTLIIVTADHGHTLSIGGYSYRGNSIFGLAPSDDDVRLGEDGKSFTTLLYANGPGYEFNETNGECPHDRDNVTKEATGDKDYRQQAAVPLSAETHGGEDVGIFARGPMSHLFHGVHEQNYIATAIRYASCVGSYKEHCLRSRQKPNGAPEELLLKANFLGLDLSSSQAVTGLYVMFILLIIFSIALFAMLIFMQKLQRSMKKFKRKGDEEGKMLHETL